MSVSAEAEGQACPICQVPGASVSALHPIRDMADVGYSVHCRFCGRFFFSQTVKELLEQKGVHGVGYGDHERIALGYFLRRRPQDGSVYLLDQKSAGRIIKAAALPQPHELVDALILHLGQVLGGPGQVCELPSPDLETAIGAVGRLAAMWAAKAANFEGFLEGLVAEGVNPDPAASWKLYNATLSQRGWERYSNLLRQRVESKQAFWASKWGDQDLDNLVEKYLRPAVKQTGYDLRSLAESARAGLIDDRLRVEIRRSRFLVADLTHGNNGAYWEAGFAEGIGLPVIYTCRKDIFESPQKPHFDTNHHLTVVWDPAVPHAAAEQLKAVIRATLPAEAILTDAPP
jgi:hypothetical protein